MDKIKYYSVSMDSDVFAISLVDEPAIEENFIYLKSDKQSQILLDKNDKHLIVGAVLVPDKPIYRNNGKEEFYIQFNKETIEQLAFNYLINNHNHSVTTDHMEDANNISLVESWIKTSNSDKSNDYGMNLPIGTWLVSMKVENEEVWQRIKSGELRGYSIESFVNLDEIKLKKNNMENKMESIEINENFWDKLKSILADAFGHKEEPIVEEVIEEIKEEVVEEPKEEVVVEELVEEEPKEEESKEDEKDALIKELEQRIKELEEKLIEKDNAIEKLSKQPSANHINVNAHKDSKRSFLDYAMGNI